MNNRRILSMVTKTSCSHISCQGSYYSYTHAWTKLWSHELNLWHLCVSLCPYLKWTQLLWVVWRYRTICAWAACPCLSWSTVAFSRSICVELDSETFSFSICANFESVHSIKIFGIWLQVGLDIHTHASCNAVSLVWSSLRLTTIIPLICIVIASD